jgi:hypothetical protein
LPNTEPTTVSLVNARADIASGDLLLFRGVGIIPAVIRSFGRSRYTHAARVVDWDGELFCCEVREGRGGRAVTLESQVKRFPGRIDVFETNPGNIFSHYDRAAAVRYVRSLCGCDYNWLGILAVVGLRWARLFSLQEFSEATGGRLFCSEAQSLADQAGGVDPVPHLPARLTEPGDLARSTFYRYRFTLTP